MKIALCSDMYAPQLGGVADSVALQARGLRALGHEVRIFAPHMQNETPDPFVDRFPTLELYGGAFCIVYPRGLSDALARFRPDVVHVHSFGLLALAAVWAARKLSIPVIGTNHGSPVDYLHYFYIDCAPVRYIASRFVSWFYNQCDIVTTPTKQPLDALKTYGMQSPRTAVISNAIDTELFRPLPDKQDLKRRMNIEHRAVLLFGRIAREKNLDESLEIFAEVTKRTASALVVVGDGPYKDAFESRVRALHIGSAVYFTGRLSGDALVAALNACDVMLVTSTSEAQPMSILQAHACGIPVVGTRAGGIPECIANGETGFVIDRDDRPGFVDHVARLLLDDELSARMSNAAQKHVAAHEPRAVAEIFERLYRTLPGVM